MKNGAKAIFRINVKRACMGNNEMLKDGINSLFFNKKKILQNPNRECTFFPPQNSIELKLNCELTESVCMCESPRGLMTSTYLSLAPYMTLPWLPFWRVCDWHLFLLQAYFWGKNIKFNGLLKFYYIFFNQTEFSNLNF